MAGYRGYRGSRRGGGGSRNKGASYFRGKNRSSGVKGGKVVGYAFCQGGSHVSHVGITNNPSRRRQEHVRNSGANGFLKVVTGAMSRARARKWEGRQSRTRGYS